MSIIEFAIGREGDKSEATFYGVGGGKEFCRVTSIRVLGAAGRRGKMTQKFGI